MTSISIDAFQPATNGMVRADAGHRASLSFVIFAGIFIIAAYIAPFKYAWYQSTYEDDPDDDRPAIAAQEGALQRQIALGTLGLVGLATLAFSRDRLLRFNRPLGWICIAYLSWCAASCLWSESFSISSRRVIGLGCEVLAGIAIAERLSPRQFAWFVFACTLTWLGLGILAEVVNGTLRPWQAGYRFNGVFYPNIMAGNCALLILSGLYLSSSVGDAKRIVQAMVVLSLTCLVLTGSRTAAGTLLVLLAIVSLIKATTRTRALISWTVAVSCAGMLFAAGLGVSSFSTDWASMGRADHDMWSLTGRVPLWENLIEEYVRYKPFAGYGYGAFWTPTHITEVAESQYWSPAYAHSAYIDLVLSVGLIGASLFVSAMILALVRVTRLEFRNVNSGYGFIAMLLGCILLDGTLETTFGSTSSTSFFCICGICCVLASAGKSRRMSYDRATA